ncbi:Oidioi.mRNA.OKI2018_I69.chr1.g372.t1.cds [Oikopleura dioica]|uniref:Oidioi.mRNA.OKI2018_I69.chr1.g372.t1.cds n=1 Tax=Oikopleura dioica TaxID=34765 RepID=A0ABN7SJM6_OIKDI|nr:Oidioi.mRNA.OKI2018_I69.chr1.g372.t1.cds [Oikopleura dioica]
MKISVILINFAFGREEEKKTTRDDCALPYEVGMCRAAIPRFYYNIDSGKCEKFTWGGCGGNLNKFPDEESCMNLCAGLTRADVREL